MSVGRMPLPRALRLGAPVYYGSLRAFGITAVHRRLQNAGLILCYHNVVAANHREGGGAGLHLSCDRFERQMRWLAERYAVVPLREIVERLVSGASLRNLAAITFDDGYAGVFEVAVPILERMGLPATVFLVADAVGRTAGFWWDQPEIVARTTADRRQRWLRDLRGDGDAILSEYRLSALRCRQYQPADWDLIRSSTGRGIEFGVHSATHRSLPSLDDGELEYDLTRSRAAIHRETGVRPDFFAYPYGLWNARVRDGVRAAGYRAALTLDHGLNGRDADPWSLRRVNVPSGISDAAFAAWASGLPVPRWK
jgi:peptidoglycan/xylan/chitin deacetylase (PgdA/CDA1 family)